MMNDEEARFKHDVVKDHKKAAMKKRQVSVDLSEVYSCWTWAEDTALATFSQQFFFS